MGIRRATAAGRTFATTGPLLLLSVDEQPLQQEDLLNWEAYEGMRAMLGQVELVFNLEREEATAPSRRR